MTSSTAIFIRFVFIFGTLYSFSNACQTCHTPWKKVYEHDADGTAIYGSLDDLNAALDRAARFRYMIPSLGHVEELDFTMAAFGQLCGVSFMHVKKNNWDHFLDDGRWRFLFLCSNGMYIETTSKIDSPDDITNTEVYRGIVWFIQETTCPSAVCAISSEGEVLEGSVDEVKEAVLAGHDMKYRLHRSFVYGCDNIDISENGEDVVSQSVWIFEIDDDYVDRFFMMANSKGVADYILWNLGEHVSKSHAIMQANTEWFVEPCWRHVYTHDENGVEQDGALAQLIAAVELGNRVKVVMGTYSIEAANVRTEHGQVAAQLLGQVSKKDSYYLLDDTYWIWQMVHTSGTVRTRRYSIGNDTNRGDTVEKKTISWFVDTRPWTKILSTEKYGQVASGSKADLKNAVENGASVRVGLQFGRHGRKQPSGWFVMKAENVEISSTGELAAELIKSVSTEEVAPGEFQIKDDPFWKFMLVTTESNVDIAQWRVGAPINDGHFSEKATVNWFVNY